MVCSYDNYVGLNDCFHFGNIRIDLSVLYNENSTKGIADKTLVSLTLMIAESRPEEMATIVKVIVNFVNTNN